jgi:hypothetical protein
MDTFNLPLTEYCIPTVNGYGTSGVTTPQTSQIQTTVNTANWPTPRAVRDPLSSGLFLLNTPRSPPSQCLPQVETLIQS